ncbi:MAG: C_GCAxxG_C_C family protein [Candidatus Lokiarchaeota archaeon]|nr:C_GCAxxG_C_C family protein [Candidatus Lokiarchaeota archaeon]
MNDSTFPRADINKRFEDKLIELKSFLPPLGKNIGNSCAADTLNSIIEVLDLKDLKNVYFNNLAIPFSGFAHYKGKNGWKGPCGAISGAIAAIGIISGGEKKINDLDVPKVYGKALKFTKRFEDEFGSVMCAELCGFDVNIDLKQYVKTRAWENKCCNFILFAVDQVAKITRKELRQLWS